MNNLRISILLSLLFVSFSFAEFAYSGKVIDRSGAGISGAVVSLSSDGSSVTTDTDGFFGSVTPLSSIPQISTVSLNLKGSTLRLQGLTPYQNYQVDILSLQGRIVSSRTLSTSQSGSAVAIFSSLRNVSSGIYIVSLHSSSEHYEVKALLQQGQFRSTSFGLMSPSSTSSFSSSNSSHRSRSSDTLIIRHSSFQQKRVVASQSNEITLDPYGPERIPTLYPDKSGLLIIQKSNSQYDTLKARSVIPSAGVAEWDEIVSGTGNNRVVYNTSLTTSTTMKADMIRAGMSDADDWQLAFAVANVGSTPFKNLEYIVIRYMVETNLDSIALSLNAVKANGDVIGESEDHGAFRAVLKRGVQHPGEFVTDTLSMADFTIGWAEDGAGVSTGASLADNLDSLNHYSAIGFSNELLPWHDGATAPVNNGDTITVTVAGILFGTTRSGGGAPIDTTTTTFPIHRNITSSTFWVGEGASSDNDFITNTESAWDGKWGQNFGLEDKPFISRDSDYIPTSSSYKRVENPYYFALPYNDIGKGVYDGAGPDDNSAVVDHYERKVSAYSDVYWANEMSESEWGSNNSMVKNRWIRIKVSGSSTYCYAQWEDAGPYYYNDASYVFGTSQPANSSDAPYAGIDLSPSVCLYLGQTLQDWGAPSFEVDWNFVDESEVPDGPWKRYVTTRQIEW